MALHGRLGHNISVEGAVPTRIAQRLPPEVVREIFLACLARDHHRLSSREAPWNVSQTCRYWRDIALETSQLWAFLDYNSNQGISLLAFEVVLDTWLLRSKKSLLYYKIDISISDVGPDLNKRDNAIVERIVEAVFQHQSRWRNLSLLFDGFWPSKGFFMEASSMPETENLELCFGGGFVLEAFTLDLASAPDIKELVLECAYISRPIPEHLQLTNLRSCTLRFSEPPDDDQLADGCIQLLHAAPNIEEFVTEFEGIYSSSPPLSSPITLPLLRYLYMVDSIDVTFILEQLTAPGLTSLMVGSEHEDSGHVLLNFIKRSQPPLTVLKVWEGFTEEEYLIEALRLLPALQNLQIADSSLSAHFLEAFSVRRDQQTTDTLCPSLSAVSVLRNSGWGGMEGLVAYMLLSRWNALEEFEEFEFAKIDCDMEKTDTLE
ncbi:hypothetical protein DFH11DRAFT_1782833 [Phellopilus nigrolimitatus]|nr:hypothetical protein DFH11DRAFT_1782833 [Phellopilus nigrolimitatus]